MATTQTRWQITGDYFENCNCKIVCPCLVSPNQPLTSKPTKGACEVAFAFHINSGSYGNVTLDGLNVAMQVVSQVHQAKVAAYSDNCPNLNQITTSHQRFLY